MEELVQQYFNLGLSYKELLRCLAHIHGIIISMRTLKRVLRNLRLCRRKLSSDILEVALFILSKCEGSEQMVGYRWMHSLCIKHGFVVTQETVRLLLNIIDPDGIQYRKRHRLKRRRYNNPGPNATWHIDGYDKLARYGVYIHGCVDGFSRRIMWMHAYYTNKNPKVIAGYFLDSVVQNNICPQRIRSDRGTENVDIEQLQKFFRRHGADKYAGEFSFLYGTSVNNQRIEWMWGLLRRQGVQYWMNFLQKVSDDGNFTGDYLDINLIRFCFLDMIQVRLITFAVFSFVTNSNQFICININPSKGVFLVCFVLMFYFT